MTLSTLRRPATPVDGAQELALASDRLARLVERLWDSWPGQPLTELDAFLPPADLDETDDAYVLEAELPGVAKRDVTVEVTGRRVTVSGERRERERRGLLRRRTRTVGRFSLDVLLPGEVEEDGVRASLTDGVLTVTLPKAAAEWQRRRTIAVE